MADTNDHINSILLEIRSGKKGRDRVIKQLYQDQHLRNTIQSVIYKHSGNQEDFREIFNTTLIEFTTTVVNKPNLKINTSINSYIAGISRYKWLGVLEKRKKNRTKAIEEEVNISSDTTPEDLIIDHDQKKLIEELLQHLGKNCKEVLMYWSNSYSMVEIADMLGYKSAGMAKKKKHICFKELLLYIEANPHVKKLLK